MPSLISLELNLSFLCFIAYQDSYALNYNQITNARELKIQNDILIIKKRTRNIIIFSLIEDMRTSQ